MRSLILGNGKLLVAFDQFAEVRDLYFPYVGLEDHVKGSLRHRLGVWVDGTLSWLSEDPRWDIKIDCEADALRGHVTATHASLGVSLEFSDVVYNESPIFLRKIVVRNALERDREIKLYVSQQFQIADSMGSDTAYFDPDAQAIIHYKGERAFLIGGDIEGAHLSDYAVGLMNFGSKMGTYYDAEDGALSQNPIEHGPVDSVVGFYASYKGQEAKTIHYWLTAGTSVSEAKKLHAYIEQKTPDHLLRTTGDYWKAWVNKYEWNFHQMPATQVALFKKSLLFVRTCVDDGGGIIASADSDTLQHGKDTYAYVWPRDAAYSALALDRAGDANVAERFFTFCNDIISDEGYFLHKYLPDRSLGSSWLPWIKNGKRQLPIQEDETALVLYALYEHYLRSRDLEFIERLYNPLVEKAANFMVAYRDADTGLPLPSYDLWEEKRGISTFTSATVYGALHAAAEIAKLLGKQDREQFYRAAAEEIREGILTHLYDPKSGLFLKMIDLENGSLQEDRTIDISSVYGVFAFGVLDVDDQRLADAFEKTVAALSANMPSGGIGRYEGDQYYATSAAGNPWFISSLWYAEYLIAHGKKDEDFEAVLDIFAWVEKHALPSGVLSEQLSAVDSSQLSVAPLTWSHAAYVNAVLGYLDRLEKLGICTTCNPVR